jgi:preprotein translocase subunit SecB
MSDTTGNPGNGTPIPTPPLPMVLNAQYVKDLSFENPRAPASLMPQPTPPEIKLDIRVNAQPVGPDVYEVQLSVSARASRKEETVFLVELTYAAVVTLNGVARAQQAHYLLVETPRTIFPFARAILADATRDGGFPPLFMQPIDFAELLRRNQSPPPATATA